MERDVHAPVPPLQAPGAADRRAQPRARGRERSSPTGTRSRRARSCSRSTTTTGSHPTSPGRSRAELDPAADGCYWQSRWIEVPTRFGHEVYLLRRRLLPWTPPKWILTTNNYAMLKSGDAKTLLAQPHQGEPLAEERCREDDADRPEPERHEPHARLVDDAALRPALDRPRRADPEVPALPAAL